MNDLIDRRAAIQAFAALPVLAVTAGCGPSTPINKAKRVVVTIAKKIARIGGPIAIDWEELVLVVKAIIDGKEETITAHITKEEAETLKKDGGKLVIKSDDGTEIPVEYRSK